MKNFFLNNIFTFVFCYFVHAHIVSALRGERSSSSRANNENDEKENISDQQQNRKLQERGERFRASAVLPKRCFPKFSGSRGGVAATQTKGCGDSINNDNNNFDSLLVPSSVPSDTPTSLPAMDNGSDGNGGDIGGMITFFATGGRFTGDRLADLPNQLASLPSTNGNSNDDNVLFHLGDWNSPFATSCVERSYIDVVNLYRSSTIPVYFVPGDNEYNDCPNPTAALSYWYEYLLDYESEFWPAPTAWTISRQIPAYPENFSFFHPYGALFIGINLVGGVVHDTQESTNRLAANLEWIENQYTTYKETSYITTMVILAHSDPNITRNESFFDTFFARVQTNYQNLQVIFVHRNLGVESSSIKYEYNSMPNLAVIVVEGSVWPIMRVQIDTTTGVVTADQENWYSG